jgi:hypothetical protein
MKRLFIALMFISSAAGATVIDRYATELDVHADGGSRAMVTLDLKNCQAGRFVLPVGFGGMDRLEVQAAPDGVVLKPVPGKESSTLEIELPPGIAASTQPALCVCRTGCPGSPEDRCRRKSQDCCRYPVVAAHVRQYRRARDRRLRTFSAIAG